MEKNTPKHGGLEGCEGGIGNGELPIASVNDSREMDLM